MNGDEAMLRRSMAAEAYTPAGRAQRFEVIAWGHSSDEYEVSTMRDEGESWVECEVKRKEASPQFGQPLQSDEISGVLEALNGEADKLGGDGTRPWAPDSENPYLQISWNRGYIFHIEASPVVDPFQPL